MKGSNNSGEKRWTETVIITTLEPQAVDSLSFLNHATLMNKNNEKWIVFERYLFIFT